MSGTSGDAAEQVVRMSLEGTEMAVRLAGSGAKQVAVLLYAVLRDQKRTSGRIRLTNMLRSGRELKVFAVRDRDLRTFCTEAKRYGVLYTVLKDRDARDGLSDILVRAEDAAKINRVFERFGLAAVDMGSVEPEERQRDSGEREADPAKARTAETRRSGPSFSGNSPTAGEASDTAGKRPSVRKDLNAIRNGRKAEPGREGARSAGRRISRKGEKDR